MTIICAYAPTLTSAETVKDSFHQALHSILPSTPRSDKQFLMGDFNASVGADHSRWGDVIGKHGDGTANSNGLRLLNTTFSI